MDTLFNPELRSTVQIEGIMYCTTHDDFAIEGYDWSEICESAWGRDDDVVNVNRCELVEMFIVKAGAA